MKLIVSSDSWHLAFVDTGENHVDYARIEEIEIDNKTATIRGEGRVAAGLSLESLFQLIAEGMTECCGDSLVLIPF